MIASFSFWDEMMKNMIINDNNLSEQIIIRLFTQSKEGFTTSHDCEQKSTAPLSLYILWF